MFANKCNFNIFLDETLCICPAATERVIASQNRMMYPDILGKYSTCFCSDQYSLFQTQNYKKWRHKNTLKFIDFLHFIHF